MVSQYLLFHLTPDLIFRANMRQLDSKAQREKTLAGCTTHHQILSTVGIVERFMGRLGTDNSLNAK